MDFLPKNFEAPKTEGNYYKFRKGENRFRIMSPAITGYEYWTKDNKPVRSREAWEDRPDNAKTSENGQFQKFFFAFVVYNYDAGKVQIMEVTQRTVQAALQSYAENKKWGDVGGYDFVVTATGDGLEREYTTIAEPHSEAPKAEIGHIHLQALLTGEDPFTSKVSPEKNIAGVDFSKDLGTLEKIKPEEVHF